MEMSLYKAFGMHQEAKSISGLYQKVLEWVVEFEKINY